jgi:hypothetical protein
MFLLFLRCKDSDFHSEKRASLTEITYFCTLFGNRHPKGTNFAADFGVLIANNKE